MSVKGDLGGLVYGFDVQMATVLIITATSAMPQPITRAPGDSLFWIEAPRTRNPQRYNGMAI